MERYPFDWEYLARLRARDGETEAHFIDYFNVRLEAKLRIDDYSETAIPQIRQETLYRILRAVYEHGSGHPSSLKSFAYGVCERVEWKYDRGEHVNWEKR